MWVGDRKEGISRYNEICKQYMAPKAGIESDRYAREGSILHVYIHLAICA